jgi:tetratricopeptide (TPR) repeat protein
LYECDVQKRERAAEYARRAIQLDPAEPFGHTMLGYCLTFLRRWPEASVHYERALELNPNDTYMVMLHALSLVYTGEVDRAIARMQYALARDPYAHDWFWDDYLIALVVAGRYKEALVAFEKIAAPPFWSYYYAAIAHLHLGDMGGATRLLTRFNEASPEMPAEVCIRDEPFADPTVPERLLADIRKIRASADDGESP